MESTRRIRLSALMLAAALWTACSKAPEEPPPPDCPKGTHQEGAKCVVNPPRQEVPAPATAPAAAGATPAQQK